MPQVLVTYRLSEDEELHREVLKVLSIDDVFRILEDEYAVRAAEIDAIKIEPLYRPNLLL